MPPAGSVTSFATRASIFGGYCFISHLPELLCKKLMQGNVAMSSDNSYNQNYSVIVTPLYHLNRSGHTLSQMYTLVLDGRQPLTRGDTKQDSRWCGAIRGSCASVVHSGHLVAAALLSGSIVVGIRTPVSAADFPWSRQPSLRQQLAKVMFVT
eukprot:2802151-Amphidinium_carterae.1